VAGKLGLQYLPDGLKRIRETGSQVGLNPTQRRVNVQDAIQGDKSALHDKNILLVDDLITTGATTIACAQAAEEAGAKRMYALAVGLAEDGGRYPNLSEREVQ
jgi:predicted amidophosphoribosyltransferase